MEHENLTLVVTYNVVTIDFGKTERLIALLDALFILDLMRYSHLKAPSLKVIIRFMGMHDLIHLCLFIVEEE